MRVWKSLYNSFMPLFDTALFAMSSLYLCHLLVGLLVAPHLHGSNAKTKKKKKKTKNTPLDKDAGALWMFESAFMLRFRSARFHASYSFAANSNILFSWKLYLFHYLLLYFEPNTVRKGEREKKDTYRKYVLIKRNTIFMVRTKRNETTTTKNWWWKSIWREIKLFYRCFGSVLVRRVSVYLKSWGLFFRISFWNFGMEKKMMTHKIHHTCTHACDCWHGFHTESL